MYIRYVTPSRIRITHQMCKHESGKTGSITLLFHREITNLLKGYISYHNKRIFGWTISYIYNEKDREGSLKNDKYMQNNHQKAWG